MIGLGDGVGSSEEPVSWYLEVFERNLRIRDEVSREQIIHQVNGMLKSSSKGVKNKKELVDRVGDPAGLGRELSNPANWVIDLGSPLAPTPNIEPFFSRRGRLLLSIIFLLALAIPIGIFLVRPDKGLLFPGMLLVFIVIWALGLSFLNTYLGYLGTLSKLNDAQVHVNAIGRTELRRHSVAFLILSMVISMVCGAAPSIMDITLLSVSAPLTASTIAASIIGYRMLNIEGNKALKTG
ncbi:MAG: hypothetical protein ACMUHM_02120 [Thermoplasmatota archaeon]